jgi:hypothetical protein
MAFSTIACDVGTWRTFIIGSMFSTYLVQRYGSPFCEDCIVEISSDGEDLLKSDSVSEWAGESKSSTGPSSSTNPLKSDT